MKIVTKARAKYKHFTETERYKLEALIEGRVPPGEISQVLKKNRVTIYREIRRGRVTLKNTELMDIQRYRADAAQRDYEEKTSNRERTLKIGKDRELEAYISKKIKMEKYSPDAIVGEIKAKGMKFEGLMCAKTLYNYIERGLFADISSGDLCYGGTRRKRGYRKSRISLKNRGGRSIETRPESINKREEIGHWEGDCIKGRKVKVR